MHAAIRSRTGTLFNSLALATLIAVLALVALVTKPPPPPNVSEFAPQAVEQIEDAPSSQSSRFGTGEGEGLSGSANDGGAEGKTIDVARVRRCVGNPPRQIEDPQSPPCVPYWEGKNGGATSKGISSDEIRVAVLDHPSNEFSQFISTAELYAEFFNRRFEFYGRKIRIMPAKQLGGSGFLETDWRATAAQVDEELNVFASLSPDEQELGNGFAEASSYYDELARRGIISVDSTPSYRSEAQSYHSLAPYQWGYGPSLDERLENAAEFACEALVGRRAAYGGPDVQTSIRKFGIVVSSGYAARPDESSLKDGLSNCGASPVMADHPDGTDGDVEIRRLKSQGVTTVACVCNFEGHYQMLHMADKEQYFPEWFITGGSGQATDWWPRVGGLWSKAQTSHLFGISGLNKTQRLASQPFYWAAREVEPGRGDDQYSAGACEFECLHQRMYRQLLVVASGIQMAGPRLTPKTFEEALLKTRFPNPGCGASPYHQACVGFKARDRTMVSDMTMIWWSESEESHTPTDPIGQGRGTFCYVRQGERYSRGRWPSGDQPFFDLSQPCR